jgi:hypothetical protein
MLTGQCHCGAVRYEMSEQVMHHTLCHCQDCRRHVGAPVVSWAMSPAEQVKISGETRVYASSEHGRRHFCGQCGTSLFYSNEEMLPGLIDVQSATLDNPDLLPPTAHIQVADRIGWMKTMHELPEFERYTS